MSRVRYLLLSWTALAVLLIGGCPDFTFIVDPPITVRVINNTDFEVDPGIEYGQTAATLRWLDIGLLAPGEVVDVDFDCELLGVLTTTDSTQLGYSVDYVLDPLPLFLLDVDYFCGELIVIEFVGNGLDFDVYVDAGGESIY